jgi:hypothetical protein
LPTIDNPTANKTETFVIQRMPFSKLINPSQYIQSICIGQCVRWGKAHEKTYTPAAIGRTIRRAADLPIGENLMVAARCSRDRVIPADRNVRPGVPQAGITDPGYKKPHPMPHRRAFYTRMKKNNGHISRERYAMDYALAAMEQMELYCQAHPGSPAAVRRPRLFVRGELWIALLGPSVEEGIVGIGSTVTAALRAFDAQYLAGLRQPAEMMSDRRTTQRMSSAAFDPI